jgi:hypothetical protein
MFVLRTAQGQLKHGRVRHRLSVRFSYSLYMEYSYTFVGSQFLLEVALSPMVVVFRSHTSSSEKLVRGQSSLGECIFISLLFESGVIIVV